MKRPDRTRAVAFLSAALLTAHLGCGSNDAGTSGAATSATAAAIPTGAATATGAGSPTGAATAAASGSASAAPLPPGLVVGVPYPADRIAKVVNPKSEPPYTGPTGTLRGVIKITGDAPPELPVQLPAKPCRAEAAATHGKLFRTGQGGALADALVTVIGHGRYVPPKGEAAKMTISRCSFARRTLAATYGQRLEVSNLDVLESYMPFLEGAPNRATLVAIPRGDAVRLYPHEPGHYLLKDALPNPHMTADVFVLAYSTHDVTGLDGKYEITGVPVGEVQVNALLPATNKTVGKRIEIKEGDNTLDLTLTFDAKKDTKGAPKPDEKDAKPPGPKG